MINSNSIIQFIIRYQLRMILIRNLSSFRTYLLTTVFLRYSQLGLLQHQQPTKTQTNKSKIQLSGSAQKALWAYRIIEMIENSQPPTNQKQDSLRQKIIKIQSPTPEQIYPKEVFQVKFKQQVMELFIKGVILNQQIFKQTRVTYGKNPDGRFIFSPNTLVTKLIFKSFMNYKINTIIMGGFGISKSISIILFIMLSRHVNRFILESQKLDQQKSELQEFKKSNLLQRTVPFCWYWSVNQFVKQKNGQLNQIYESQQQIMQILLHQVMYIDQSDKDKLSKKTSLQQLVKILQSIYPDSIKSMAVIDQINVIFSLMKKWNMINFQNYRHLSDRRRQKERLKSDSQFKRDEQNYKINALRLRGYFFDIIQLSGSQLTKFYKLNSSVNIQEQLLNQTSSASLNRKYKQRQILTFGLNRHNTVEPSFIYYQYNVEQGSGKCQFLQMFWFELWRNISSIYQDKDQQNLKKIFYQAFNKQKINSFSRFLYVNQFVKKLIQIPNSIKSRKNIITTKIAQDFLNFCIQQQSQKILHFLNKCKQNERIAIACLIHQATILKSNNKQIFKLNFTIEASKRIKIIKNALKMNDYFSKIIPYEQIQYGIKFLWTPSQFIDIMNRVKEQQIQKEIFQKKSRIDVKGRPQRGAQVQRSIRKILEHKNAYFQLKINDNDIGVTFLTFTIKEIQSFIQFKSDSGTISANLKNMLKKAQQFPGQNIFGYPIANLTSKQEKIAFQSIGIDFIIVMYNQQVKKYIIYTFDITISDISSKSKQRNFFLNIMQRSENQKKDIDYELYHIIISPEVVILRQNNCKWQLKNQKNQIIRVFPGGMISANLLLLRCQIPGHQELNNKFLQNLEIENLKRQ